MANNKHTCIRLTGPSHAALRKLADDRGMLLCRVVEMLIAGWDELTPTQQATAQAKRMSTGPARPSRRRAAA